MQGLHLSTGLTERGIYENRMGWNDTRIGTGIVGMRQQGRAADCGTSNFRSDGSLIFRNGNHRGHGSRGRKGCQNHGGQSDLQRIPDDDGSSD